MPPPRPLQALAHREFRIYFAGQAISLVGLWMQQVAQGWVIVGLTGSTAAIALISFVASVPMLVLSMHGGVVADRHERRKILILTQLGLAILAFAYAGLVAPGWLQLWHVYALALVWGVVAAFDLPAQQALVPQLVPPPAIPQAVALNQALFHGARLVGPAVAGILMAATSTAAAFVANGLSYFAVIWSLSVIRPPARPGRRAEKGGSALSEGLRYIAHHHDVRAVLGFTGLTTAFIFPLLVVFMPVAVKQLYTGDEGALGYVMSASGLGAMAGALSILRVPAAARGAFMIVGAAGAALGLAGLAFVHVPWAAAPLVTLVTFSVALGLGLGNVIVQVAVPDELRGRVMGVHGLMFTGIMPSSALLLGLLADGIGLRTTLVVMAGAYALLAISWLAAARAWRFGRPD